MVHTPNRTQKGHHYENGSEYVHVRLPPIIYSVCKFLIIHEIILVPIVPILFTCNCLKSVNNKILTFYEKYLNISGYDFINTLNNAVRYS